MTFSKTLSALLVFAASCVVITASASAQTIFVNDAKIVTNSSVGTLETGDVLIQDGRIASIGETLTTPKGAQVIEGAGKWVTPGLFAGMAQVGLVEIGAEAGTNDSRAAKSKTSVSERASDSFNPNSPVIGITRAEGISHAAIVGSASHNIFGGTGIVADTAGTYDSIKQPSAFIYVQLGQRGASLAGGSRSAALSQLRAALDDALLYPSRYDGPQDGDALSRQDAAALASAARGGMPLVIGADRAVDLMNIMALKERYSRLDIIILGAAEGWMVADELAANRMKVMIDPLENLPGSFDRVGSRLDNAALLKEAGVEFAIMTRSAGFSHNVRLLPQQAGNAVANGLDWDSAFAAISSVPAGWFDVSAGRIVRGNKADIVVWDGDPLEVTSSPTFMMIEGAEQSLESRQSKLRDRYNPSTGETKPHKYR